MSYPCLLAFGPHLWGMLYAYLMSKSEELMKARAGLHAHVEGAELGDLTPQNDPPTRRPDGKTTEGFSPAPGGPSTTFQQKPFDSTPLPHAGQDPKYFSTDATPPGAGEKISINDLPVSPPREILPTTARSLSVRRTANPEYKTEYAEMMLDFFTEKEKNTTVFDTMTWRDGREREYAKTRPNAPPMFSEFGRTIGVSERTLKGWAKKYPDFREAYEMCVSIIQEFIVENGLLGTYPAAFAIFAGKNLTPMKDKVIEERQNLDVNRLLDQIEQGRLGPGQMFDADG